ncbi:MAG: hypothetical protein RBS57_16655, partial [Desulforhabdus sp.]|nr:hypothetical protein [Desulforhabdus sp.]
MAKQFTVISGNRETMQHTVLLPEEKLEHWRNIVGAVLQDAQTTWGEIWKELQGEVTDGCMVLPQAENGFNPRCGWRNSWRRCGFSSIISIMRAVSQA